MVEHEASFAKTPSGGVFFLEVEKNLSNSFDFIQGEIGFILPKSYISYKFLNKDEEYNQINFYDFTLSHIHGTCIGDFLNIKNKGSYYNNLLGIFFKSP